MGSFYGVIRIQRGLLIPQANRNAIPGDYFENLRRMYKQSDALIRSNTRYGWVPRVGGRVIPRDKCCLVTEVLGADPAANLKP